MSKKILISINPEYVEKILSNTKKYEYRTKRAREEVSSLIIYETAPIQRVVAEVEILDVIVASPNELWEKTKEYSGINKKDFEQYFKDRDIGYAYKLGKVKKFKKEETLDQYGLDTAPQSFVYI